MPPECGSCAAPTADDDRFCSRCGTPIPAQAPGKRSCARCGFPSDASDRYCSKCGSTFAPPEMAAAMEGDGFEDILAGWDLDLPPFPAEHDTAPTSAIATAPPQAPLETAVLDRPIKGTFLEERQDEPAEPRLRLARAAGGFPWGATAALLGAVAVIISAILPWDSGGIALPRDIPAASLLDPVAGGPNLGLVLLGLGTTGALVALLTMAVPATAILRRLIGVLTFAIPLAFVMRALGPSALVRPAELIQALGAGAFAAAAGGFIQAVAGRWSLRGR